MFLPLARKKKQNFKKKEAKFKVRIENVSNADGLIGRKRAAIPFSR